MHVRESIALNCDDSPLLDAFLPAMTDICVHIPAIA